MERRCPRVATASPFLHGILHPAEAAAYRQHVRFCICCRREVDELEPVVRLLKGIKADIDHARCPGTTS